MLLGHILVQHRYQFLLFHSKPPVFSLSQFLVCFDNSFSCQIPSRFISLPKKEHYYFTKPQKSQSRTETGSFIFRAIATCLAPG